MKSAYKYEFADAAGVSRRTFRRWLKENRSRLSRFGVKPTTHLLPPRAVRWICLQYGIEFSGLNMNVTTVTSVTSVFKRHSKSPCLIVSESRHDVDEINNRNNRNKRFQERRMQGRPFSCSSSARDGRAHFLPPLCEREPLCRHFYAFFTFRICGSEIFFVPLHAKYVNIQTKGLRNTN